MDSLGYIVRRDTLCDGFAITMFENVQSLFGNKAQETDRAAAVRQDLCDTMTRQGAFQTARFTDVRNKHSRLSTYILSHSSSSLMDNLNFENLILEADRFLYVYVELVEPCLSEQTIGQCMHNRLALINALSNHLKNIYNDFVCNMPTVTDSKKKEKEVTPLSTTSVSQKRASQEPKKRRIIHKQLLEHDHDNETIVRNAKTPSDNNDDVPDDSTIEELLFGL